MKIFWNTKKFTEYKTSSEEENVSLNIKFFSEYKNMNFAPKSKHSLKELIKLLKPCSKLLKTNPRTDEQIFDPNKQTQRV